MKFQKVVFDTFVISPPPGVWILNPDFPGWRGTIKGFVRKNKAGDYTAYFLSGAGRICRLWVSPRGYAQRRWRHVK